MTALRLEQQPASPRLWNADEYHALAELGAFDEDRVELLQGRIYLQYDTAFKTWPHEIYHRAAEAGLFDNQHVELIDGEIYVMSPMSSRHAAAIRRIHAALAPLITPNLFLTVQTPLWTTNSEPEPDVAIIAGSLDDYDNKLPSTAELVVEVSLSSLELDRTTKSRVYALADVGEYWIVNLVDDQIEVHRDPTPAGDYQTKIVRTIDDQLSSLAVPQHALRVRDLIPARPKCD